jgi:hypothetical protein
MIPKVFFVVALLLYSIGFPINKDLNTIDALITLFMSLVLVFKSRKNLPLSLLFIFILYINYSIVVGEYIVEKNLYLTYTEVRNVQIYGITIRIMLFFVSVLALFFKQRRFDLLEHSIKPIDNSVAYYLSVIGLVIMLFWGLDRGDLNTYSVRISPLFEYSKILFLFAYYFSGKSSKKRIILFGLLFIFVFQDAYYGGRVTSLQLLMLFALTFWIEKLTFLKIIGYSLIGIVFSGLIGVYRITYSIKEISFYRIFESLSENYFVFSTAIQAYYSSATHVAASGIADVAIRYNSLIEFLKLILGSSFGTIEGNVTLFVNDKYFKNNGGGIMPTHFFFWLGWAGVLISAIILVFLLNKLNYENSTYQKFLFFGIIINAPRWYLYSPNQLFRGTFLFITLLWLLFGVIISIFSKKRSIEID